jgi:hypothetical protein
MTRFVQNRWDEYDGAGCNPARVTGAYDDVGAGLGVGDGGGVGVGEAGDEGAGEFACDGCGEAVDEGEGDGGGPEPSGEISGVGVPDCDGFAFLDGLAGCVRELVAALPSPCCAGDRVASSLAAARPLAVPAVPSVPAVPPD